MSMNWKLGFGAVLAVLAMQAQADQSVVIDTQSVGQAQAADKGEAKSAPEADAKDAANEANKERFLRGGKMSPRERAAVMKAEKGEANKQSGLNFLAANKGKPGVNVLPSGVQYKILREGKGQKPSDANSIRCRYKGMLTDGSIIDRSDKASWLKVGGMLSGLKEAVKLMPTGSKWEIVIPSEQAYGTLGNRGVGPNAVLVYEMEILGIK